MRKIYIRDVHQKVVIPNVPTLREMVRKFLATGEMPELMSDSSESFDFASVEDVDFNADLKFNADISDFIKKPCDLPNSVSISPDPSPIESAPAEQAAPSENLTNGAD